MRSILKGILSFLGLVVLRKDWLAIEIQKQMAEIVLEKAATGIIHIGAHNGQESSYYESLSKKVIWIEGNPRVFSILKKRIKGNPNQKAILALLGDRNLDEVNFFLTNNDDESASIFPLSKSENFKIENRGSLKLPLVRLDSLIDIDEVVSFDYWILDVQGAELQVLKGAGDLLDYANFLKIEVSTYELYRGGALLIEIEKFLGVKGFISLGSPKGDFHGDIFFIRRLINSANRSV